MKISTINTSRHSKRMKNRPHKPEITQSHLPENDHSIWRIFFLEKNNIELNQPIMHYPLLLGFQVMHYPLLLG